MTKRTWERSSSIDQPGPLAVTRNKRDYELMNEVDLRRYLHGGEAAHKNPKQYQTVCVQTKRSQSTGYCNMMRKIQFVHT